MELLPGVNHEHLLSVARRIVGPLEAEDVVSEAYLKALKAQETFRGDCRPSSWLHRITQRCALDVLRRRARRPEQPLYDGELDAECGQQAPRTRSVEFRDAGRRLDSLPKAEQDALRAVTEHETIALAAAALGITTGSLKTRLRTARLRLAEAE
jgi:RNA polymerase sigma-70 factor (ECF subfamily)